MNNNSKQPRVVITGLGAISPLGSSLEMTWKGYREGRSGIRRITRFDCSEFPCQIAGEIPDFDPYDYMDRKEVRRIPRSAQIALATAIQAVKDAGLPDKMPNGERSGVIFGTAIGGLNRVDEGMHTLRTKGLNRVNPFTLPSGIHNLSSFLIAKHFQCLGPNSTITTACATGTQAIGEAAELIRRGAADIVLTGGTEALISEMTIGGFAVMRALPVNFNDNPEAASRPFDAKREGFIFSEGAACLVLEKLEVAQARGARIYAEVLGQASSADAFHLAAPDPSGAGQARAMQWAIKNAGIEPYQVDYINAHGSSTPVNDGTETSAIKDVFGEHAYKVAISSTKSMIGHPMGAAGALEALACIMSINQNCIAPTINYEYPDPDCDLDYVPNQARQAEVNITLSNSFGLGGQNACLVLGKFND
jgi:beta-ketoacyl-acyl-carrier-protein synthase II